MCLHPRVYCRSLLASSTAEFSLQIHGHQKIFFITDTICHLTFPSRIVIFQPHMLGMLRPMLSHKDLTILYIKTKRSDTTGFTVLKVELTEHSNNPEGNQKQ